METERGRRIMTIIFVAAFVCFVVAMLVAVVMRAHAPSPETPPVPSHEGQAKPGVGPGASGPGMGARENSNNPRPGGSDHK